MAVRDTNHPESLAHLSGNYLHNLKMVSGSPMLELLYQTFFALRSLADQGQVLSGPGLTVYRFGPEAGADTFFLYGDTLSEAGFVDEQVPTSALSDVLGAVQSADPSTEFILLVYNAFTKEHVWFKVAKFAVWLADVDRQAAEDVDGEAFISAWSRYPLVDHQKYLWEMVGWGDLHVDDLTDREFEAIFQRTRLEMSSGMVLPGESPNSQHVLDALQLEKLFQNQHPSLFDELAEAV